MILQHCLVLKIATYVMVQMATVNFVIVASICVMEYVLVSVTKFTFTLCRSECAYWMGGMPLVEMSVLCQRGSAYFDILDLLNDVLVINVLVINVFIWQGISHLLTYYCC